MTETNAPRTVTEATIGAVASTAGLGINRAFLDTEEDYLREMVAKLQAEYAKAAAPYIERLVLIYSLRPAPPVIVTLTPEQAEAFRLLMPNVKVSGPEGGLPPKGRARP